MEFAYFCLMWTCNNTKSYNNIGGITLEEDYENIVMKEVEDDFVEIYEEEI